MALAQHRLQDLSWPSSDIGQEDLGPPAGAGAASTRDTPGSARFGPSGLVLSLELVLNSTGPAEGAQGWICRCISLLPIPVLQAGSSRDGLGSCLGLGRVPCPGEALVNHTKPWFCCKAWGIRVPAARRGALRYTAASMERKEHLGVGWCRRDGQTPAQLCCCREGVELKIQTPCGKNPEQSHRDASPDVSSGIRFCLHTQHAFIL